MKKFVGFDLEIAKGFPEDKNWKVIRPLGITCASAVSNDFSDFWVAEDANEHPSEKMTKEQCVYMVNRLVDMTKDGYSIVTWNGLQFDFDVLQEESGLDLKDLALNHIDIMFQFFCLRGYPVGLNTVARSMGLSGKLEGRSGALAPVIWKTDPQLVINYVIQDGRTTLELAEIIEKLMYITWTSKSGKAHGQTFPNGLLSVKECLAIPKPDTSWMTDPMTRERFMEWMK